MDVDRLIRSSDICGSELRQHVFVCRSDRAKLRVIQERVQAICQEMHDLQRFASSTVSDSKNSFPSLGLALQSASYMLEGVLTAIEKEEHACLKDLHGKMPASFSSGTGTTFAHKTRFQVADEWRTDSLVKFTCAGIEYQVKAPSNTNPGDWLEFDSTTCILTKFDR